MKTLLVVCVLVLSLGAFAQEAARQTPPPDLTPERKVAGQTLPSAHDPALTLEFDKVFKYAGSQRFTLYGVADAEQHFFADVAPDGTVKRFYWVQFEGYLPSNDHTYKYEGKLVEVGGLNWFSNAAARVIDPSRGRPDSDGAHAYALFKSKGWKMPGEMLMQRLVYLTDASKRKELMIIYGEDIAPTGYKAADLQKGGSAEAKADEVMQKLLERAKAGMEIRR